MKSARSKKGSQQTKENPQETVKNQSIASLASISKRKMSLQGRQVFEKDFLDKFNNIMQMDKSKDIKFFSSVGDFDITNEQTNEICEERLVFQVNTPR